MSEPKHPNRSKLQKFTEVARAKEDRILEKNMKEWVYRTRDSILSTADISTQMFCSIDISSILNKMKASALKYLESQEEMEGLTFSPSAEELENDEELCANTQSVRVSWD